MLKFTGTDADKDLMEHYWLLEETANRILILDSQRDYSLAVFVSSLFAQEHSDEIIVDYHENHGLSIASFDGEELHFPASIEDFEAGEISFDAGEEASEFEMVVMAVLSIFRFYIPHIFIVQTDAVPFRWMPAIKLARQTTKLDIRQPLKVAEWVTSACQDDKNLILFQGNIVDKTISKWKR